MLAWALVAGHVPGPFELYLSILALSWALFVSTSVWMMYAAIEPYVRRHWPEALISWVRLIGGRGRDPLAASHVLAGALAGLASVLPHGLVDIVVNRLPGDLAVQPFPGADTLNGIRTLCGSALILLQDAVFSCGAFIFLIVLLRLAIRRNWAADVVFAVLYGFIFSAVPRAPLWHMAIGFLFGYCAISLLRRFGLLAFVSFNFFGFIVPRLPLTVTGFFAGYAVFVIGILIAIPAWALYAILRTGPVSAAARAQATLTR